MSQTTYIKDRNAQQEYINEISTLGKRGWRLDTDANTSNEYMKTFINENGDVAVAYRGTQTWVGEDGRANVANTVQLTKARQLIKDKLDVDLRTKKAQIIKQTNDYIKNKYGDRVKLTTGHSQGAHDSTQAKRAFFNKASSVVFHPAPGGEVQTHEGKMFTTPHDVVSTKGKIKSYILTDSYMMNVVQSTDPSLLNKVTAGHMLDNMAPPAPFENATREIEMQSLPKVEAGAESLVTEPGFVTEIPRSVSLGSTVKNYGKSAVAGVVPGMVVGAAVDQLMPDANDHLKMGTTAVGTSAVMTSSTLMGAAAAPMSATLLPLYASYEAANLAGSITDDALPDTLNPVERGTITGASSGAVGGLALGGATVGQSLTGQAIAQGYTTLTTPVGYTALATTEGVEMGAIGAVAEESLAAVAATEGVELATLGAAAATGAVAAEEASVAGAVAAGAAAGGLGLSELGPLAVGGALLGAGIGLATALINQPRSPKMVYALNPGTREAADKRIGRDAVIRELLHDLPLDADDVEYKETLVAIQARIDEMDLGNYQYQASLRQVPDNSTDDEYNPAYQKFHPDFNVMLDADYSQINAIMAQRREAETQREVAEAQKIEEETTLGNRREAESLQFLLDQEAANFEGDLYYAPQDERAQLRDNLTYYRNQRESGTLPEHLESVFQERETEAAEPEP